ncbi:MAG: excinuclease ABC subunit UvrC [Marinifilaceae bacterium]|jgi:excinuclease ABC subunit C|nr:excinuclease ABC subunit UvrC [Marinifilaceae bacterium]
MNENIVNILLSLPEEPGVYQYFNVHNEIIYIGKAKNLRKRINSYFKKNHESPKTRILVRNISDIKFILVDSEHDALLLENNLIKKYKPRYNILLKDDKTYPWICIKREAYPRVFVTRKIVNDGSEYYGPYTSVYLANILIELFKSIYKLRTCKLNLNEDSIQKRKYKVCLEYHIGNCLAPCIGNISEEIYLHQIKEIRSILKGNISKVNEYMKSKMKEYAENLEFEEAHEIKMKLQKLEDFKSKSIIVSQSIHNVDVFNIDKHESYAFVNFFKISNGSVIQSYTSDIKCKLDESEKDILSYAIVAIRDKFNSNSNEILVPFDIDLDINSSIIVPKIGDKKKLLDLSKRNIQFYKREFIKQQSLKKSDINMKRIMQTMKNDLNLNIEPRRIECFDNSNIQGNYPVASCVVFINGKPAKKEYRHFNIKTVEGPNDFASMEEILYRRYKRCLEDKELGLPDLVIVDGGKGQLSSALKALDKLNLIGKLNIIALAKKLEEVFIPGDPVPMYVDKNSETLKIIQQLRDESHRFAITFHRNQRSKGFISSELDNIKGIGDKTKEKLYKKYKTIGKIKEADIDSIIECIGKQKGKIVYDFFKLG